MRIGRVKVPGNKKPKKKYRPKSPIADPLGFVLEGFKPLRQQDSYLLNLKVVNHGAMLQLTRGAASLDDINTLLAMSNGCVALVSMGIGAEYREVMDRGVAALQAVCDRACQTDRVTLYAHEITALNEFIELHDAQLDVVTVAEMSRAIEIAKGKRLAGLFHHALKKV